MGRPGLSVPNLAGIGMDPNEGLLRGRLSAVVFVLALLTLPAQGAGVHTWMLALKHLRLQLVFIIVVQSRAVRLGADG